MSIETPGIRSKRLGQLIAVQHELTAAVAREQVLQRTVAATTRLVPCQSAGLLLYDEATKQLRFAAATRHMDELAKLSIPVEGSIAGAAFSSGEAILVKDAEKDPRYFQSLEMATGEKITSLLAVPLQYKKRRLGVVVAEGKPAGQEFSAEDIFILTLLAEHATIAIDNAALYTNNTQAEIKRLNRLLKEEELARQKLEAELRESSSCDQLTGVFNRHQFFVMAEQVFQQAIRYGTGLSIVIADVDRFKRINDDYGREVGDQALKRLAGFLSANLRACDILGRLEGEAFAILMPETGQEMACQASIRLIEGIRLLAIATTPSHSIHITISIGVAELNHLKDKTLDTLIDRAEHALSEAKHGGRDRMMIHVAK